MNFKIFRVIWDQRRWQSGVYLHQRCMFKTLIYLILVVAHHQWANTKISSATNCISTIPTKIFYTRGGQPCGPSMPCGSKRNFCGPNFQFQRISDFSTFWVYFFRFLLSCGPKSLYFWQNFQVAAQRPFWVGHPCSIQSFLH